MAVWAVVAMDVEWFAAGDEYFLRFTARDGSEIAVSVAGSVFEAHGNKLNRAVRKRADAHTLVRLPGAGRRRAKR
jgi:hypothetical protein